MSDPKQFVFNTVERNREAIALLCDNIFYFAELGMQEFETSKLMMELLEKAGFEVEKNLSGMPTGFVASCGSGKPVIALHTEFDATPACSQQAGVIEPTPIVDGCARTYGGPQCQRRGDDRGCFRDQKSDGSVRTERHSESIRRSRGGAAREPAVFRARRAFSRCRRGAA
jgi:hypothetical protein